MMNQYVWRNYLQAGGAETVKTFQKNLRNQYTQQYADFIRQLHRGYCPDDAIIEKEYEQLSDFNENEENVGETDANCDRLNNTYEILLELWKELAEENDSTLSDEDVFYMWSRSLSMFSTALSMDYPDLFLPYYFQCNFNVLSKIADVFEIDIPDIPLKKNYKERFFYYGMICEALHTFRKANKMSAYEFCAFLYDFAPKYIGGINSYIYTELPEPKGAFLIGGRKNDWLYSDQDNKYIFWQSNTDTRVGDLLVFYLCSPVSALDSVWRSVSDGFNDPFFYYYHFTYLKRVTGIKRITLKQLKTDPLLNKMPIVKKNMQGVNGVELRPSEYNHIAELANLHEPLLENAYECDDSEFACERDVEEKRIIPLLQQLGYLEDEYDRQLHLEIGNHNTLEIPDFVVCPTKSKLHTKAFAVIEAKYEIRNKKEFEKTKNQVRSYARQLCTRYSVIATRDKLWVFKEQDDFENSHFVSTWGDLRLPDCFAALYKLLGKKKRNS